MLFASDIGSPTNFCFMIWALRCQLSSFASAEKENDKSEKQKLEADIVVIELDP